MYAESYIANGLRYIKPYYTTRSSYVKGRWLNKSLIDILTNEFKTHSKDYYLNQIHIGNYRLQRRSNNNLPLQDIDPLNNLIQNGDILITKQHKHEPPVKAWNNDQTFKIIYEDDTLLVIDKPAGIPVHPTGQFYLNTITEIIKQQQQNLSVFPCYRLDKVTSGLLILAKDNNTARQIQMKISNRNMNKIYLARVKGKFPFCHITTDIPHISSLFKHNSITTICTLPIYSIEPKKGFPAGLSDSKPATTSFYPIRYLPDTNESIIACKPQTGRTHQIRIHLTKLGYPIVNDSIYCEDCTTYPERLQFVKDHDEWESTDKRSIQIQFQRIIDETNKKKDELIPTNGQRCPQCDVPIMNDPNLKQLQIFLHAWQYNDNEGTFNYQTELPKWVN